LGSSRQSVEIRQVIPVKIAKDLGSKFKKQETRPWAFDGHQTGSEAKHLEPQYSPVVRVAIDTFLL
jgi:hypothetical protein